MICVDKYKNYKWLTDETAKGFWGTQSIYEANDSYDFWYICDYFYLVGGQNIFNELRKKCIAEHGEDFKTPQPADSRFTLWAPFARNQSEMFPYIKIDFTKLEFK